MLIFGIRSTSDDQPGWSMDLNPICQPSPAKKMKCFFLDYIQLLMIGLAGWWTRTPSASPLQPKKWNATFWITFNFWWLAGLVNGLKPHPPPLSSQRNEMLIFVLCSTSNDQPGLSMDLNPIHHLCPAKKWKAHLPGLVNGLKPHPTPLQPKKMKCLFLDYVHFWWSAWLIDELEPHLPPLSSQKNEMLIFGLRSTSDNWPGWLMDSNPICHPSSVKKWNPHFWIMFNFWWSTRLVNGLEPHLPAVSSQ